jgi:hypothetical protein
MTQKFETVSVNHVVGATTELISLLDCEDKHLYRDTASAQPNRLSGGLCVSGIWGFLWKHSVHPICLWVEGTHLSLPQRRRLNAVIAGSSVHNSRFSDGRNRK